MKPRNLFSFGASFTLAAIYSRGTCRPTTIDVLMFHFRVRNGTGWDHQAMTTRFQEAASCSLLAYLAVICACGLLCCVLAALWQQADIRVACVFVVVHSLPFYIPIKQNCLSPGCCIRSVGC